ncbi:MAG: hypothetical protein EOP56_11715 [Sphingobacteriales bacterium]|nr:MAG: hypothetical protein EOP56_11715 [Sphingobacteriales bacterium]
MGKKNYKFNKNQMVHAWVDADQYQAEYGSLPTAGDIQQRIYEKEDKKRQLNNNYKEKFGKDLFLPNGRLNDKRPGNEDEEPNIVQELKQIKEQTTKFFKTIKSIFSK